MNLPIKTEEAAKVKSPRRNEHGEIPHASNSKRDLCNLQIMFPTERLDNESYLEKKKAVARCERLQLTYVYTINSN